MNWNLDKEFKKKELDVEYMGIHYSTFIYFKISLIKGLRKYALFWNIYFIICLFYTSNLHIQEDEAFKFDLSLELKDL